MTITIAEMLPKKEYDVKLVVVGGEKGEITNFIPQCYYILLARVRKMWNFFTLSLINLLKKFVTLFFYGYALKFSSDTSS